MSEVNRYVHKPEKMQKISRFYGPNSERQYVQSADLDAAQIELAALREDLAEVRKAVPNSTNELVDLRKRLAAAEQRNSVLVELLNQAADLCASASDQYERNAIARAIRKCLAQHTESGASE